MDAHILLVLKKMGEGGDVALSQGKKNGI